MTRTSAMVLAVAMVVSASVVRVSVDRGLVGRHADDRTAVVDGYPLIPDSDLERPGVRCFEVWWDGNETDPEPGWRRAFYDPVRHGSTTLGADWSSGVGGPTRPCAGMRMDAEILDPQ